MIQSISIPHANCATISEKNSKFFAIGEDGAVQLWSLGESAATQKLSGHSTPVTAVALTSRDEQLLSGSSAGTMRLWDLTTGSAVRSLRHTRSSSSTSSTSSAFSTSGSLSVTCVRFHPCGDYFASAGQNGQIGVWDLRQRKGCLHTYASDSLSAVTALAFSAGGRRVLSGDASGAVRAWDLTSGQGRVVANLGAAVTALAVDERSGTFAVSSAAEAQVWGWDSVSRSEDCVWTWESSHAFSSSTSRSESSPSSWSSNAIAALVRTEGHWAGVGREGARRIDGAEDFEFGVAWDCAGAVCAAAAVGERGVMALALKGDGVEVWQARLGPLGIQGETTSGGSGAPERKEITAKRERGEEAHERQESVFKKNLGAKKKTSQDDSGTARAAVIRPKRKSIVPQSPVAAAPASRSRQLIEVEEGAATALPFVMEEKKKKEEEKEEEKEEKKEEKPAAEEEQEAKKTATKDKKENEVGNLREEAFLPDHVSGWDSEEQMLASVRSAHRTASGVLRARLNNVKIARSSLTTFDKSLTRSGDSMNESKRAAASLLQTLLKLDEASSALDVMFVYLRGDPEVSFSVVAAALALLAPLVASSYDSYVAKAMECLRVLVEWVERVGAEAAQTQSKEKCGKAWRAAKERLEPLARDDTQGELQQRAGNLLMTGNKLF